MLKNIKINIKICLLFKTYLLSLSIIQRTFLFRETLLYKRLANMQPIFSFLLRQPDKRDLFFSKKVRPYHNLIFISPVLSILTIHFPLFFTRGVPLCCQPIEEKQRRITKSHQVHTKYHKGKQHNQIRINLSICLLVLFILCSSV
jgi:hypothetical protein